MSTRHTTQTCRTPKLASPISTPKPATNNAINTTPADTHSGTQGEDWPTRENDPPGRERSGEVNSNTTRTSDRGMSANRTVKRTTRGTFTPEDNLSRPVSQRHEPAKDYARTKGHAEAREGSIHRQCHQHNSDSIWEQTANRRGSPRARLVSQTNRTDTHMPRPALITTAHTDDGTFRNEPTRRVDL